MSTAPRDNDDEMYQPLRPAESLFHKFEEFKRFARRPDKTDDICDVMIYNATAAADSR